MITVAICDDEQYFLNQIRKSVQHYFSGHNQDIQIPEFDNGEALLSGGQGFDLILMDLKLPGRNGMEVIEQLRSENSKSQVIFVTSYEEYALQAFHVDAVHYLLKPVSDEKLHQALERALGRMGKNDWKTLAITKGSCTEVVSLKDILYCEAMDHRLYIHTKSMTYDYLGTLEELEKQLDSRFFRCHKSYIVNMNQVVGRQGDTATVSGGGQVLISRRRKQEFAQRLLNLVRKELL